MSNLPFNQTESQKIENMVIELINIQRNCCLIDSNFSINIILAASFYAWKCINSKSRLNVNLKEFQSKFKIKCNLNSYVTKLIRFLIELCKLMPWILDQNRINRKTIYFYTQDLLNYSSTLVGDYMKLKSAVIDKQIVSNEANDLIKIKRFKQERFEFNDLNDELISDSEIDTYIRTDKEIEVLKKIKSNLD